MENREIYVPSGRIGDVSQTRWLTIVDVTACVMMVNIIACTFYDVALNLDFAYFGFVWIIPVLIITVGIIILIKHYRLRTPLATTTAAGGVGFIVLFLGPYYVDRQFNWTRAIVQPKAHEVSHLPNEARDWLPNYIRFRMETDRKPGGGDFFARLQPYRRNQPYPKDELNRGRWVMLGLEFFWAVLWPMHVAYRCSRRPFDEMSNTWLDAKLFTIGRRELEQVTSAVLDGRLTLTVDRDLKQVRGSLSGETIRFWHGPAGDPATTCYVQFLDDNPVAIKPDEIAVLAQCFPTLKPWASDAAPMPIPVKPEPAPEPPPPEPKFVMPIRTDRKAVEKAVCVPITSLPIGLCKSAGELERAKRHSMKIHAAATCLTIIVAAAFGCLVYLLFIFEYACLAFVTSGLLLVPGWFFFHLAKSIYSNDPCIRNIYLWNAMLEQAVRRSPAFFDHGQYLNMLVEIRWHSGQYRVENESELGLMLVNFVDRVLLYDGDSSRWIIPFASILGSEVVVTNVAKSKSVLSLLLDTSEGERVLRIEPHVFHCEWRETTTDRALSLHTMFVEELKPTSSLSPQA